MGPGFRRMAAVDLSGMPPTVTAATVGFLNTSVDMTGLAASPGRD